MRNTPPNRLFLAALVLSQCLASALSWQVLSSSNLFSPRSSLSPLQKSDSRSRFLRIHHPRRRSTHLHGDDGESQSKATVTSSESTASTITTDVVPPEELIRLQKENEQLRESLQQMEIENGRLLNAPSRIIMETFEREGSSEWCDELEDGTCPIEPTISFGEALRDRGYWLVGLLILQSGSGIILARNEALLANHPVSKLPLVDAESIYLAESSVRRFLTSPSPLPHFFLCCRNVYYSYISTNDNSHLLSYHAGRSWRKRGQPSECPSDSRFGLGNPQRRYADAVFDARTENGRFLVWHSLCHGLCAGDCLSNTAGRDDCHYSGVGRDCLYQYLSGSHLASDTETSGC